MIKGIRQYFDSKILAKAESPKANAERPLQLATAALLVEMTRADHKVTDEERQAVDRALSEAFDLTPEETRELVTLAESELRGSASLFQFTHLIDKQFPLEKKIVIVEMLWRVAYSDACKDHHEEHLVRKIADLLHVPHSAFIRARHKAEGLL